MENYNNKKEKTKKKEDQSRDTVNIGNKYTDRRQTKQRPQYIYIKLN